MDAGSIICFTFNQKYIQHVAVAISSIILNNPTEKIEFHLIYSNVSQKSIDILLTWLENQRQTVYLYKVNPKDFKSCPCAKYDRLTKIAYYRIKLSEILPQSVKKVLYLDPDVVVLKNLTDLFNINIDNYPLAAVTVTMGYFNSGVLLVNLDYWRKHNISKKLFSYINDYPTDLELYDQDALNAVLKDIWLKLPPKYNAGINILNNLSIICNNSSSSPYSQQELEEAYKNPVIIHYAGSFHFKPWYKNTIHPRQYEYLKYLKNTPYKNYKLKKHYLLSLMAQHKNPYSDVKNIVYKQIKDAFILRRNFFDFLIRKMYNSEKLRGTLFSLLTRILFLNECVIKNKLI